MLNQAHKSFSKMHARRNPNLSIQSTASYSQLSPQVQSATSGAFLSPTVASRRGLLSARSPPPSPNLPSLIPRHGKKGPHASGRHSRLVKKILVTCCGAIVLCWIVLRQIYHSTPHGSAAGFDDETGSGGEWEMVGGNGLPQEPSAVAVMDLQGKMRWTVSIPHSLGFPLRPEQYRDICQGSMELAATVRQDSQKSGNAKRMLRYNQEDVYFIDVQEAEEQGLLPTSKAAGRPRGFVEDEGIADGLSVNGLRICDRTLTYVMETEDAGFGNSLMRMWMSYGLAQAENRTFFIDDTRWPYGRYKSFFAPPPTAPCAPPPPSHMLPCPHTTAHFVVSGATIKQTFGHAFTDAYEDATKMRVARQHRIFALARAGYEALFKLRPDDAEYVEKRIQDLYTPAREHGSLSIAMHIRHGDKHPLEYQYSKDYIPLSHYVDAVRTLYTDMLNSPTPLNPSQPATGNANPKTNNKTPPQPTLVLASDDPLVYLAPELSSALRAQDRILLASKAALEAANPPPPSSPRWLDETTGWEGGFYHDIFFSLGRTSSSAASHHETEESKSKPDPDPDHLKQIQSLRELVGRAYLLDLAVLGRADAVVCGVASTSCRLLGVMLGWEAAVQGRRWRNVDGGFEWRGVMW